MLSQSLYVTVEVTASAVCIRLAVGQSQAGQSTVCADEEVQGLNMV